MFEQKVSFEFNGKPSLVNAHFFGPERVGDVLALHGLGTQGYCFDKLAEQLKTTLIAIDWYGYDKSDRRLGEADTYTAKICADWLLKAICALQAKGILSEKFSIIAVSMSAIPVALNFPKLSPTVNKIILVHPAGLDKKINRKMAFGLSSGILSDLLLKILTLKPIWEFIWKLTPIKSSDERRRYIKNDVMQKKGEFEVLRRYSKSGFDALGNMRATHYIPQQFEKIKCPVLLLHGDDTTFYNKEYLEFAKNADWKIMYLPNTPHNMIRSHAGLMVKPINDFLFEGTELVESSIDKVKMFSNDI